jgi:transposase
MPKRYPSELRGRAVRLVAEHRAEYESEYAAIRPVAANLGITSAESLQKWVRQAEVDGRQRPGMTSGEAAEIRRLKRENAELRRANEILWPRRPVPGLSRKRSASDVRGLATRTAPRRRMAASCGGGRR